jgi:hypothetical protein
MPRSGPLRKRVELRFAPLTIIFARNEEGKTTVVETLAARLLGRHAIDELAAPRFGIARARVEVEVDGATITLEKRDDELAELLRERGWEIGAKLLALLVVRGADTRLLQGKNTDLREFLMALVSREDRFRALRGRMEVAGQDISSFHDGVIHTAGRGTLTTRYREAHDRHAALSALTSEFAAAYADAAIPALRERMAVFQETSALIERRRRHRAWRLAEEIASLEAGFDLLSAPELERLRDRVIGLESAERQIQASASSGPAPASGGRAVVVDPIAAKARAAAEAGWLEDGLRRIEVEVRRDDAAPGARWLLPAALILLIASAILLAARFPVPGFSLLGLAGFAIMVALLQRRSDHAARRDRQLTAAWSAEFLERYPDEPVASRSLSSLEAAFRRRLADVKARAAVLESRTSELEEKRGAAMRERTMLEVDLKRIGVTTSSPDEWPSAIRERLRAFGEREGKLERQRGFLQGLGVRADDYLAEPVDGEYSTAEAAEAAAGLGAIERELREKEEEFRERRSRLRQALETDAPEGGDSYEILAAAAKRLESLAAQARATAAALIAGTLVHRVVEELLADDRAEVERALSDPMIAETIATFTAGRYRGFGFNDDASAFVEPTPSDAGGAAGAGGASETDGAAGAYECDKLSTGARDQLFLALRVGLAQRLAGEGKLFLLLDDAFQHADWSRRETLVERTVELVRAGWQAVVFTMDDHILGLFRRFAAERLGEEQVSIMMGLEGEGKK